ncbi:hypothetical protein EDD22DRAFT_25330 [Suillus occidentalis]|nr:hypothetical protein EDD22DRAFT_25330 [Suillus occidentalis]
MKMVHVALPFGPMDTPARLKTAGFVSQNSEDHMCPCCDAPFCSLVDPACFDRTQFHYRDSAKQLKWKFIHGHSDDPEVRATIAETKGVRMSILDRLPTWNGSLSIPTEIMHLFWGPGTSGQIHRVILIEGSMFTGTGKRSEVTPMDRLTGFLESIWWPNNSGRFQIKIASGGERPKADEWRNFMRVYPVAIAVAWQMWSRNADDEAPYPKKRSKIQQAIVKSRKLLHKRRIKNISRDEDAEADDYLALEDIEASHNYHSHYENILRYCAATRIFASREITPQEAIRAENFILEAFQSWAQMNCHLTPNFHFSSHVVEYINAYGPAYAWWVFPYERAIGVLGKANHNGHGSGEVEGTYMRAWWKTMLIQELLTHLQERPDQTEQDQLAICALLKAVRGGAEADWQRGTLMNYIALLSDQHESARIVFPKQFKLISLRPLGFYAIVLQFLRLHFPEFNLTSDAGEASDGIPFNSQGVRSYANVNIGGAKYGSFHHHRGKGFCYGYTRGRHAVRVEYILSVNIPRQDPPISVNLALIRCFEHHPQDANHPWSLWATDLGIATWKYNVLGSLEACHLDDLSGQFAFAPVHAPRMGRLWVTFSLDTTSQEPDNSNH